MTVRPFLTCSMLLALAQPALGEPAPRWLPLGGPTGGDVRSLAADPHQPSRLFLGTMDGFGWYNNVGSLRVSADTVASPIPEPGSLLLLGAGLVGLGRAWRKRRG